MLLRDLPDFFSRNREGSVENKLVSCPKPRSSFGDAGRHRSVFGVRRLTNRFEKRHHLVLHRLHTYAHRADDFASLGVGIHRRLINEPMLHVSAKADLQLKLLHGVLMGHIMHQRGVPQLQVAVNPYWVSI
jgi:hypothetical protein